MNSPRIGFVGMTHLGLISAVAAAEKGFYVDCFDTDKKLIEDLKNFKLDISEPELMDLIVKNHQRLNFSFNFNLLRNCEILYVAPDVMTDDEGQSDLSKIDYLLASIYENTTNESIVVVLSQVPPGFTRTKMRHDRILFYQVETLIFGRAINRALFPERFIIGCADPKLQLPNPLRYFLEAYCCPVIQMGYEGAELAKISINMCLVATVTTANILAEVCESIGANWTEIIPALKLDKRIGEYAYLKPGLGISGGNLERDLATIISISRKNNIDISVIESWKKNSNLRKDWIWSIFRKYNYSSNVNLKIAILGLTYKENTHSLKNSPALVLLDHLKYHNVVAYDPIASRIGIPSDLKIVGSATEAINDADVVVLSTAWPEFKQLSPEILKQNMRGNIVIDPYGLLNEEELLIANFRYYKLGKVS